MATPDNLVGLYHDDVLSDKSLAITQYLQSCNPGWDTYQDFCYFFSLNLVSLFGAQATCGNVSSFSYCDFRS